MVTAESVKAKLQGLISLANNTTGKTDTDLTAAVNSLIAGFGQGGGGGVMSGNFTPADNLTTVTVDVGGEFTNFLLTASNSVTGKGVKATKLISIDNGLKYGSFISTNNAGTALISVAFDYRESDGIYATGNYTSYVVISGNKLTAVGSTNGNVLGHFVGGVTYQWYAW